MNFSITGMALVDNFSATGNLLPGCMERPDMEQIVIPHITEDGSEEFTIGTRQCGLNILGYIPLVSTVTGTGRALLGFVHTIVHLACCIFCKNRSHHCEEASLGAKNIGRGMIEVFPFIGNIAMIVMDRLRAEKFEKMTLEQIKINKAAYYKHAAIFAYGQEIARRSYAEVLSESSKINNESLDIDDIARIIRSKDLMTLMVDFYSSKRK